jgi:hypothetical protein
MVGVSCKRACGTALAMGITVLVTACYSWGVESPKPLEGLGQGRDARVTLTDGRCVVVESAMLVGQRVTGYGEAQRIVILPAQDVPRVEFRHGNAMKTVVVVIGISGVAARIAAAIVAASLPHCTMGSC